MSAWLRKVPFQENGQICHLYCIWDDIKDGIQNWRLVINIFLSVLNYLLPKVIFLSLKWFMLAVLAVINFWSIKLLVSGHHKPECGRFLKQRVPEKLIDNIRCILYNKRQTGQQSQVATRLDQENSHHLTLTWISNNSNTISLWKCLFIVSIFTSVSFKCITNLHLDK